MNHGGSCGCSRRCRRWLILRLTSGSWTRRSRSRLDRRRRCHRLLAHRWSNRWRIRNNDNWRLIGRRRARRRSWVHRRRRPSGSRAVDTAIHAQIHVSENDLVQITSYNARDLFLESFAFAFEIAKVTLFLALFTTGLGALLCELSDLIIFADRARRCTTGIRAVRIHPVHAVAPAHVGLRHLCRGGAECENQSNPSFELHVVSLERFE